MNDQDTKDTKHFPSDLNCSACVRRGMWNSRQRLGALRILVVNLRFPMLLSVKNLEVCYGVISALQDVSLEIAQGERVAALMFGGADFAGVFFAAGGAACFAEDFAAGAAAARVGLATRGCR